VRPAPSVLVLDASALVDAVLHPGALGAAARELLGSARCHAPHLIDAEVGSVIRLLVLRGELGPEVAEERLSQAGGLVEVRYEMCGPLAKAAGRLRAEISFDDALYVALASVLQQPLLTSDDRLVSVAGRHCEGLTLS
jgi:predicted nucleic acid-binding protein